MAPVGGDAFPPGKKRAKERIDRIVLDVELDADRLQVALDDRFGMQGARIGLLASSSTRTPGAARPWHAPHRRLLPSRCHPAVYWPPPDQTRTGRISFIARMQRRAMVGAQQTGEPMARLIN